MYFFLACDTRCLTLWCAILLLRMASLQMRNYISEHCLNTDCHHRMTSDDGIGTRLIVSYVSWC